MVFDPNSVKPFPKWSVALPVTDIFDLIELWITPRSRPISFGFISQFIALMTHLSLGFCGCSIPEPLTEVTRVVR